MKKEWKESRWQRIARFRLGNEMRESRYWEEEEEKKRKCRLCNVEREIWEDCGSWRAKGSWRNMMELVLEEKGEGENWLRKLERARERTVNEDEESKGKGEESRKWKMRIGGMFEE